MKTYKEIESEIVNKYRDWFWNTTPGATKAHECEAFEKEILIPSLLSVAQAVEKAGRVEKRNTEDPYVDHYVRKENGELRAWRGTDFEGNGFNAAISQSQHQLSEFFERPEDAKKE